MAPPGEADTLASWEGRIMICTLFAALAAGIVFAIFELVALHRRLRRGASAREAAQTTDVAAGLATAGLLGGGLATAALVLRHGASGKARPTVAAGAILAAALLAFVLYSLGCERRPHCQPRRARGPGKLVGFLGLVCSLTVVAAATVRLKAVWQ